MCSANIGAEMTAAIILFSACSISKSRATGIARKDDQHIHRRMYCVHDLRGHLFKGSSPAAVRCFPLYLYFVFALAERKNEIQKEGKAPLRMTTFGHCVSPVM